MSATTSRRGPNFLRRYPSHYNTCTACRPVARASRWMRLPHGTRSNSLIMRSTENSRGLIWFFWAWAPTRMWAAMRPSSAVEANPEQRAFHARLMDEFQAGAPGTSKTYDLRRAGGSRALSLASDVKHD